MSSIRDRLVKVLIENKLVTKEQLNQASEIQRQKGGSLSQILVDSGIIDEKTIMMTLSSQLGIPPINLSRFKIDSEVTKLIDLKTAKKYKILPISKIGNRLTVAISNPLNILVLDDIKLLTGYEITVVLSTEKDIISAVEEYYGESADNAIEKIVKDMENADGLEVLSGGYSYDKESVDVAESTQQKPVVKLTNMFLRDAVKMKASDILLEPFEKKVVLRYRVDGILQETSPPPKNLFNAIVSRIKIMSNLNIAEHRLPQDGRFKLKIGSNIVDFRTSVLPSSYGEKVCIRVLDKTQVSLDINKLGFSDNVLSGLSDVSLRPHGMILACGPTGSGKTTTLYSILNMVNDPKKNIVTVEDPVEYQLKGINQVAVNTDVGLTFASALRSILRQDPDVVLVGEIRDAETVDIAIKAALTGHLVLSTLHTNSATGTIVRLINMQVEPFLITASLIAIIAQRLLRRLCESCKVSYKIEESVNDKVKYKGFAVPTGTFYKNKGCSKCKNTGYKGRVITSEFLMLSPAIKELILKRAYESEIRKVAREEGMLTLRESGLELARQGVTSLEEVLRVTMADAD